MTERPYHAIGDVLGLLREEFPEITISKIRFLESRGLLVPERTPSGFRRFSDADVERLRWILRQQRENFLPLKVIKGRLEGDPAEAEPERPAQLFDVSQRPEGDEHAGREPALVGAERSPVIETHDLGAGRAAFPEQGKQTAPAAQIAKPVVPGAAPAPAEASAGHARHIRAVPDPDLAGADGNGDDPRARHEEVASPQAAPRRRAGRAARDDDDAARPEPAKEVGTRGRAARPVIRTSQPDVGQAVRMAGGENAGEAEPEAPPGKPPGQKKPRQSRSKRAASVDTRASLTLAELASASALQPEDIDELEAYGLLKGRMVGGVRCYDEEALVTARLAAKFARHGIEARHLRIFKHAADRQAGLYEQVVTPLLRQRNPESRAKAAADLEELSGLGATFQKALLVAMLRDLTG
jgi:DNA-binding transcriptional MerR regulator